MAKQTFTTGQVLTAAQMTSLQQTAMGGGSTTAKTTSYVLVAADAGTTVIMNSASSTTITVNTSLFSAGDSVYIQNIGAGVSTITAGTATVTTAATLALAQWEGGTLYFTSTSASIFLKGAGATAASGGMTLLSTTTLSGSSTSITGISASYKNLLILINDAYASASSITVNTRFNADSGNNYSSGGYFLEDSTNYPFNDNPTNQITVMQTTSSTTALNKSSVAINVYNYTSTGNKFVNATSTTKLAAGSRQTILSAGHYGGASAISSIQFTLASGTWSGGTVLIYGVS
jgi:hypothetical protein